MPENMRDCLPISSLNYERIFRIIHGILLSEISNPLGSCLYFGILGSEILRQHHGLNAKPVIGSAAYRMHEKDSDVLVFAENDSSGIRSSESGFHCWVEAEDYIIDFQAPIFKEILARSRPVNTLERKAMQMRIDTSSPSLDSFALTGTHWHEKNLELTTSLLNNFYSKLANLDFIEISKQWYKMSPKDISRTLQIGDQNGRIKSVALSPLRVNGSW